MMNERYAMNIYNPIIKTLDENYDMTHSDHILHLDKVSFMACMHTSNNTSKSRTRFLIWINPLIAGSLWVVTEKVNNATYIYDSFEIIIK